MKPGIMEIVPYWECLGCGHKGLMKDVVIPARCPMCGSDAIKHPPIKIEGGDASLLRH